MAAGHLLSTLDSRYLLSLCTATLSSLLFLFEKQTAREGEWPTLNTERQGSCPSCVSCGTGSEWPNPSQPCSTFLPVLPAFSVHLTGTTNHSRTLCRASGLITLLLLKYSMGGCLPMLRSSLSIFSQCYVSALHCSFQLNLAQITLLCFTYHLYKVSIFYKNILFAK